MPEGGISTATTYIRPYKTAAGKSAIQTMEDRFTYGLNPEKLGAVSSYLCDPNTAPAEFLLVKSQYLAETGRAVSRGALFFQIRQAFLPGEVTAEEANRIGYETVMRWTKGKYQFFVCTHTDKAHIQEVEKNLNSAILAAERASMTDEELIKLLRLLLEVNHE